MSLVKLLKLKRAAYQLAYRDEKKVVDIALEMGYRNHASFTRIFKKHFQQAPSQFRKSPDWNSWYLHYEPILTLRAKIMQAIQGFTTEIVEFPTIELAVMEHRGSPARLGNTIAKFIEWRKSQGLSPTKSRTFNLIYDDIRVTDAEAFRFDICCELDASAYDLIAPIVNKSIPAGKCVRIRHVGSEDAIGGAVSYLYTDWLQSTEYELRDFPVFLERRTCFPDVPEHEMVTDIYLPIKDR